jgi:hypothetical protein
MTSRRRRLLTLAVSLTALLLVGCGEGGLGDSDEMDEELDGRTASAVNALQPLVLYYGTIERDDLNYELIVPGLDVVFTGHGAGKLTNGAGDHRTGQPESGLFKGIHDHGGKVAYTMSFVELIACLYRTTWRNADNTNQQEDICPKVGANGIEDAALFIEGKFKDGFDYLNIDEVRNPATKCEPPINFGDNSADGAGHKLRLLIEKLAAMGHDRKVMIWFSPGATDVTDPVPADPSQDSLYKFRGLFKTCIDHCRKMMFETYAVKTSTVVNHNYQKYHQTLARRLHNILPGTNRITMAGVGIGNSDGVSLLDLPKCDIAPLKGSCGSRGGLQDQFEAMHSTASPARYWRGVGFWSLGRVTKTSVWDVADFAKFLRTRTSWWVGK